MNRRIARNGLLVLGLCALATLLPTQRSEAQQYTCEDCMNGAVAVLTLCFQYGGTDCVNQYNAQVAYCQQYFCS